MAPTFHIRPLAADELDLVVDLSQRIWPIAYAGILAPGQIDNLLTRIYSPDNLAQEIADGHRFWLAERKAAPLGYASGYREGGTIWLKKLYVLPQCQGQGIGRALMDRVIAAFLPADNVRLFVNNGNLAAQRFYEGCGFVRAAEVPVRMGDFDFTDFIYARPLKAYPVTP